MSPLDDELRRTLDSRAERLVPPADPLAGIEARARSIQHRRQAIASGGVAAAVLAVAFVVPLANRREDNRRPVIAATGTPTVSSSPTAAPSLSPSSTGTPTALVSPTARALPTGLVPPTAIPSPTAKSSLPPGATRAPAPSATTGPSPSPAPAAPPPPPVTGGAAKAIYYVGDSDGRPVLYREFRRLQQTSPKAVLQTMMTSRPLDPDYRSLWPAGSVVSKTTLRGDVLSVDLGATAARGQAGSGFACLTLQQLVWTATAAEPQAKRVLVTVDGRAAGVVSSWWGVGCGKDEPMARRTPSFEVLAAVQISSHNEGGTVSTRFTMGGEATVFEATVSWSVVDKASGRELAKGFANATAGAPGRGSWQAPVTLTGVKAGQGLELRAWESSAQDGRVTHLDTKTVRAAG